MNNLRPSGKATKKVASLAKAILIAKCSYTILLSLAVLQPVLF